MNQITTVAVDLAKDLIVACAADAAGRTQFYKRFGFHGFAAWAANLPPCTIAMEACSSAHYWALTSATAASTVKTWLTIRPEPTRVDRSSSRVNAAQRMRTPCAT